MKTVHSTNLVLPYLGLVLGILASSTAAILIRFAQSDAPSISIAALRLSFATLMLAPFVFRSRIHEIRQLARNQLVLIISAGVLLAVHFASWISSLAYTSVASSVVIVATSPIWVAIAAVFLLKEKINRNLVIGLVAGLGGSVLIGLLPDFKINGFNINFSNSSDVVSTNTVLGNFLAWIGALCSAGYLVIGRKARASISLLSYIFIVYGVAAAVLLVMTFLLGLPLLNLKPSVYLWCFLLALIPQLIGHSSFNWALKFVPVSLVSLFLLVEPIVSTILAILFLNESPKLMELLGGVLILVGVYVATRSN